MSIWPYLSKKIEAVWESSFFFPLSIALSSEIFFLIFHINRKIYLDNLLLRLPNFAA